MPTPDTTATAAARLAVIAALGVGAVAAVIVATFAAEETVARLAICQTPSAASLAPLLYICAVAALALICWAATRMTRRHASRRGPAPVLITVAGAGVLFSALVALLGVGFWASAAEAGGVHLVVVAILFLLAFTGPSVALLLAGILIGMSRSRPMPTALPPLVLLAATATSAAPSVVGFWTACL